MEIAEDEVLKKIKDERVFKIALTLNSTSLKITEMCDKYFSVKLTREEVIQFANEILEISKHMKDVSTLEYTKCKSCKGLGYHPTIEDNLECRHCKGKGKILINNDTCTK